MAITHETLRLVAQMRAAVIGLADGPTRSMTAAWVRAWDSIAYEFALALDELVQMSGNRWPTRGQIERAARAKGALDTARRALERLAGEARSEITIAATAGIHLGVAGQYDIVISQLPPGAQGPRFRQVADNELAAIVDRTAQQITAHTAPISAAATEAIKTQLVRGIAMGDNPREVARRMLARVEGEFHGGLARAMNIARTEILDAHRNAAMLSQLANSDILRGWVWTASLTGRTCASCWSKHGSEHPLDEPGPQDHPSGRCSRTPLTKTWRELGFGISEPPSLIPDAQATFRQLPRAEQLHVMGPGRLAALDRGDVAWSDLSRLRSNPGWRDSWSAAPVKDLLPA